VRTADESLIQLVLERGLLTPAQLAEACARMGEPGTSEETTPALIDRLVQDGAVDGWQVARLLAQRHGLPTVDLQTTVVNPAALAVVPRSLAERCAVFPFARTETALRVAVGNPFDLDAVEELRWAVLPVLDLAVAPAVEIRRAIRLYYGQDSSLGSGDGALDEGAGAVSEAADVDAPVIRLVESIIGQAMARRASDIHLEPFERRFRIRYRIDGVLQPAEDLPRRLQRPVVSRLKIMANMNIAEKRLPQDGRARVSLQGRTVDLRISSLPAVHGESLVLRLLEPEKIRLGVAELGLDGADQKTLARLLTLPDGIVLVTGPTGSGKTTTLYACLHHLNKPDRKIITVEDPVEYQLAGINQVPVQSDVGMTFAAALRAILRQAPNIVMVGEIRDRETAEMAINAALTGHLVFSTLHTNDASGAVTRLLDLGVKPFLVAAALRAVVAQRLVRRVCPRCARPPSVAPAQTVDGAGLPEKPAGAAECPSCGGAGYSGRVGIFELLTMSPAMQQLIHEGAGVSLLRRQARAQGMSTLREDGLRKARAGLTTVEEVLAATVADANET
jgi:general secretion pathway protein E/type IV pilus assembly protein PilB